MLDPDSLVATRAKRSNAGSRLKQLIEIEEQASGVSNIVYSEEDENVQLLFQEDENDEEFKQSEDTSSEIDEDEKTEEQGEVEGHTIEAHTKADNEGSSSDIEAAVNSDEMLSDSDISESENDESEGERELQKTEREKKRKRTSGPVVPVIKKPKINTAIPKAKPKTKHSELLMNMDRRASSRKSAMRNKEILVQKLKQDESRRAALTPLVRVDEVKLTQEDRLAQAVETEKENVLSLHSFLEQEIVKKEHQKLMFQQRRVKLRKVIRLLSRETFVAPVDEIEDARHVQDLFDKKKRGRRRKAPSDITDDPRPGDVDTELPYYKKEMEEKRIMKEKEAKERDIIEKQKSEEAKSEELMINEGDGNNIQEGEAEGQISTEAHPVGLPSLEEQLTDQNVSNVPAPQDLTEDKEEAGSDDVSPKKTSSSNDTVDESRTENEEGSRSEILEENVTMNDTSNYLGEELVKALPEKVSNESEGVLEEKTGIEPKPETIDTETKQGSMVDKILSLDEDAFIEPSILGSDDTPRSESLQTEPSIEEKKVKFADEAGKEKEEEEVPHLNSAEEELDDHNEEQETVASYRPSRDDGFIYEGPLQHVCRNYITLMEFDEDKYPYLPESEMKTILFGKDANLGASRRFKEVKLILKSSIRLENPYAMMKEEKEDDFLKPVTEITEDDTMFEELKRLPRLGVKETITEEEEDVQKEETADIQIRTEAPTGLYLPNGHKKLCLISGKEVRYFDPTTGIPYENKDVYKVIKTIEQGLIPWYSIGSDQNTYGGVQIYLNNREGARHAKGVPDGFDGC